jgi:hypothetical protein
LAEHLYAIYDHKFAELIKPIALEISEKIRNRIEDNGNLQKSELKQIMQLFIQLKLFIDKGMEVASSDESQLKEFSSWFADTTNQWNEFSVFTVLQR